MANIKSSIKRIATNEKKAAQNKTKKSALKTVLKKLDAAVSTGAENAGELYQAAVKSLDKAASKGIIHKNAASRKKSRLAARLKKESQAAN